MKKPFDFFENTEGKVYMKLNYYNFTLNATLQILDGYYKDKKMVEFQLILFKNDANTFVSPYSQLTNYKKIFEDFHISLL